MFAIIGEVNRKLPDQQRISYLWGYAAKYERIIREYQRLCPGGRLVTYYYISVALGLLLGLAFAWQFGFFRSS
jgi:hypothetical protein